MGHGEFIWADLSSLKPAQSRAFYGEVFGWHWTNEGEYHYGVHQGDLICGHYRMPNSMRARKMAPFWMTYIATTDIDATVELAKQLGGTVEIEPTPFDETGEFALIRDPLGAGFCVYEGEGFDDKPTSQTGQRAGHILHVTDPVHVLAFYQQLFGWTVQRKNKDRIVIETQSAYAFTIQQIKQNPNKSAVQYWAVFFRTTQMSNTKYWALKMDGQIAGHTHSGNQWVTWMYDPDGAFFGISDSPTVIGEGSSLSSIIEYVKRNWTWLIPL